MDTMWKNLPDEIINAVCEYWSPRMEMVYRRLRKMDEIQLCKNRFEDKVKYVNKIRFLPIPERINALNTEELQRHSWRVIIPHIRYTDSMCILTSPNFFGRKQFNYKKRTLKEFHTWIEECVVPRWRGIISGLHLILRKKYPVMAEYIKEEDKRLLARKMEHNRRLWELTNLCRDPRRLFA